MLLGMDLKGLSPIGQMAMLRPRVFVQLTDFFGFKHVSDICHTSSLDQVYRFSLLARNNHFFALLELGMHPLHGFHKFTHVVLLIRSFPLLLANTLAVA